MSTGSAPGGLRHNRNWRALWLGQAASLTGDSVFGITILLWVATVIAKGRSWAPAAAGGVLIAEAVPVLVPGPLSGVWVDRWNRRRVMMAADACRALLIAALLTLPVLGDRIAPAGQLAAVYGVVAAGSCCAQFFNPARLAVLGRIVSPADRARASGMLQATSGGAAIIGPPLAAPLLFAFGVQWALIINAASFGISFAAIGSVRPPAAQREETPPRASLAAEFRAGVRFFAGSRVLVALCAGVVIATLGTGALNTLQVFFLSDNLHAAASWLGTLYATAGAGAVAGAVATGWMAGRIGAGRVFWLGMIAGGLLLLGYSRLSSFPVALGVVGLVGLAFGAINAAAPPLLLASIPQHLIGRVMSVFTPLQQLAGIASTAVAGWLAGTALRGMHAVVAGVTFGPIDTIFGVSALLIMTAGVALIRPLGRCGDGQPPASALPAALDSQAGRKPGPAEARAG